METTEIVTTAPTALQTTQAGSLAENPVAAYLAGLASQRTRTVQLQALAKIAEIISGGQTSDPWAMDWAGLRYSHTQAIRTALGERYAAATCNRLLSAMRGVLRAAFLMGLISAEDYQRAVMVKAVTGTTLPAGRGATPGEISALMADCENDPSPAGVRDAALIAVWYTCGLRRAELAGLDLADYDPASDGLKIRGKRNKERLVYLINGAARAVADWLAMRGNETGALFCAINKGGRLSHERLTAQALYNLLARRCESAGVKTLSPHDLRRSFCSDMLAAGADIATVAKLMGHASVNTTARYDRRPEAAKKAAAGLLHIPYHGRLIR
jgi:site-specific recombinase XerD